VQSRERKFEKNIDGMGIILYILIEVKRTMDNGVKVRLFEEADTDELYGVIMRSFDTALLAKVYEESMHDIWTGIYTKKYISGMAKIKHLYVALSENKIVGCAAVSLEESMAYVSAVYIDPQCQGKGIGKILMKTVEQDEISKKTGKLFLHALLTAIKFYKKQGYYSESEIPVIFNDSGVDVVRLVKEI